MVSLFDVVENKGEHRGAAILLSLKMLGRYKQKEVIAFRWIIAAPVEEHCLGVLEFLYLIPDPFRQDQSNA
ncbi:MAG: hypothetical protein D3924_05430 [Candidatus Electrothrix sp. AR4]|nr:hypothetical protein [Candidatus Electrothrix sp. AR4]